MRSFQGAFALAAMVMRRTGRCSYSVPPSAFWFSR
jgi:hypothetical protein